MTQKTYSSQEMLARLVGFDTTSCYSNLQMIDFIRDWLEQNGARTTLIHDTTKNKANLFATLGPDGVPGVVLSGHTDVVPVEGQDWSSDPFTLREHDGLLYGRGTCDMKGFISVALAKVPEMAQRPLSSPIHFALSYDEEVGCLGVRDMAKQIGQMTAPPKLCIVGEPTGMKPITGHKGIRDFECIVRGKECHSSLAPYGVNAVEAAADLITYIKSVARRMQQEGPFNRAFDPPFSTLHSGMVQGGTAVNIVPNHCRFSFEIRSVPELDSDALVEEIRQYAFRQIEPAMKDIDPRTGIEFREMANVPAFDIDDSDPMVDMVLSLSGANATEKVSFATEAGVFSQSGVPTVVCGPGYIDQAHKPDEFVAQDQLRQCEVFIDRLIERLRA